MWLKQLFLIKTVWLRRDADDLDEFVVIQNNDNLIDQNVVALWQRDRWHQRVTSTNDSMKNSLEKKLKLYQVSK